MGKNTAISWTDHTWNPWQGCKKISPGCKNCYMFDGQKRWGNDPENIHRSAKQTFNMPLRLKDPGKVFVCSWSDFFLKEADLWRDETWEIIRNTPHLTYQILTKRPENIKDRLPEGWPFKNVWLGVTAENQEQANIRIPILLEIKPVIRFVSVEPMLEPVSIFEAVDICLTCAPIHWIICGGESGSNYRSMDPKWAKALLFETRIARSTFFMKQMSAVNPKIKPIPDYLNIKEFPK